MGKHNLSHAAFLLIVPLVLGIIWFRSGNILGAGESGLPFYDLKRVLTIVSHTWATPLLGGSIGIQVGAIPTDWFLSQLQNLGVPGFAIEALFFVFLFIVAGFSIDLFTKELFPNLNKGFRLLAVWFYWFNPISLVTVWNRFLYNYMVFWALLPLSLLIFLKGLRSKNYHFAILTAFSSAIFSYALTSIVFNALLFFTLLYSFLFFFLLGKNKLFGIKYLLLFLICFILFNFWWLNQLFSFSLSSGYSSTVSQYFKPNENFFTLQVLSERLGLLSNIFAFTHYDFFAGGMSWAKMFISQPILFLNLLVMTLILWVILRLKNIKEVVFLGSFLTAVVYLMKGIRPPFGELYQFIFLNLPILQIFRNPFEKFSFLLLLASAPLFALAVERLLHSIKGSLVKLLIWISVFGIMIFWGYPFWTGLIFTGNETQVPEYYRKANDWLKSQGDNFRFVSLPLGGEGMTYTWDKPYSGVELSTTLFDTPNISFNTSVPYFSDLVSNLTKYEFDKRILEFFPFINSKYLVWRNDVDFRGRRMADPLIVREKLDQFAKDGLISTKFTDNSLAIYELNDKAKQWSKIYISSNLVWSNESDLSQFENYGKLFDDKFVIINSQSTQTDNIIIKPAKIIASFDVNRTAPIYNLPGVRNLSWLVYQFEVPFENRYKFAFTDREGKLEYYFDGEKITDKIDNNSYFVISKGLHELALLGEYKNFLSPVVNHENVRVTGNDRFSFNIPAISKSYLIQYKYIPSAGDILPKSNTITPSIIEDIGKPNDPLRIKVFPNNESSQPQGWVSYYNSTPGARTASFSLLPLEENICEQSLFGQNNCRTVAGNLSININDLVISQIKMPEIHLLTQPSLNKKQNKTFLEWEKVNPTLYRVKLKKLDSQPEVLVFSELFDSGWKINGSNIDIDSNKHILVNSYANGWWLDKAGNYKLNLEYMPEKLFNIGKTISGSAIILWITIFLISKIIWRKSNR